MARQLLLAATVVTFASCDSLDVGDLNNPGLDEVNRPSATLVNSLASGLVIGARVNVATPVGLVTVAGVFGREGFNINVSSDPRNVSELVVGPLNPGSFGGALWAAPYANIRNANLLLAAIEKLPPAPAGPTDAQKAGLRGFGKTMLAHQLQLVILSRDANGAVIDVPTDPTAAPGPIVSKAEVYSRINQLLDQAKTDLEAAGPAFSFPLGAGYVGFDTPATFLTFNRGLRARSAIYMDDFAGALAALQGSFLSTSAPLTLGVYHVFGTGSGDAINGLFDPNGDQRLMANPTLLTKAQLRADQTRDLRAVQKLRDTVRPGGFAGGGISSDKQFAMYSSITAPVPIMRNEELILLRAEANLGLNRLSEALDDLNLIRRTSGGLADYSGQVAAGPLLDELLYNKRYSLLNEGGFSWYDYRHYNKLATLDRALPGGRFFTKMPFPRNECLARPDGGQSLPGCGVEAGQ